MENENTAISSPVEERISRQPEELSDSQQAKTEAPPPPDFLLPRTQIKPVPPSIRQAAFPPMDYPPPVSNPEVQQAGNGKPSKSNSALAVLAVIAIVTIVGCIALILFFDLLGLRSHWTGVLSAFSPDKATQMPTEPMEPPMEPPVEPSPTPKAPFPSWPEQFSSLPEEPSMEEPPEEETRPSLAVPLSYRQVWDFDENGLAAVYDGQGWGLIDQEGNEVLECAYDYIHEFSNGYAVVELEGFYGLVTILGELAVQPEWEDAFYFSEGLLPVCRNGKYGFIDLAGNEIIPLQYDDAYPFTEGYAVVISNEGSFFIDNEGQRVSPVYEEAYSFSDGLAPVMQNGKWGYVDASFELVIPCNYDDADFFTQGYAVVRKGARYCVIDAAGNEVSPLANKIWLQENAYAVLELNGYLGLYDLVEQGYLITPQYRDSYLFSEGVMPVTPDGVVWYYVDEDNRPAIPGEFDLALPFREGIAPVMQNGYYGLIDQDGNIISEFQWDYAGPCKNGMVAVEKDGWWGFLKIPKQ